ncbi:MAG: hypothetical protein MRERV_28c002, partial [Mycoplasmataceae bacterium RV_VA103A]
LNLPLYQQPKFPNPVGLKFIKTIIYTHIEKLMINDRKYRFQGIILARSARSINSKGFGAKLGSKNAKGVKRRLLIFN